MNKNEENRKVNSTEEQEQEQEQEQKKGIGGIKNRKRTKKTSEGGKNYLLVIGIDDYAHCTKLNNAVSDAQAFKEVLIRRYEFEDDKEYTIELYNKKATKKAIYNAFDDIIERIDSKFKEYPNRQNVRDNFILYFSGHGEVQTNVGYWIPREAKVGHSDEYIYHAEIVQKISTLKALHVYFILDCCYSGDLFTGIKDFTENVPRENNEIEKTVIQRIGLLSARSENDLSVEVIKNGLYGYPSRQGITSSRKTQTAGDGKPGTHSPFAKCLLECLDAASKYVRTSSLAIEIQERMMMLDSTNQQTSQNEKLRVKGDKGGEFIFFLKNPQTESEFWEEIQVLKKEYKELKK